MLFHVVRLDPLQILFGTLSFDPGNVLSKVGSLMLTERGRQRADPSNNPHRISTRYTVNKYTLQFSDKRLNSSSFEDSCKKNEQKT